jgi:hypothetical protein
MFEGAINATCISRMMTPNIVQTRVFCESIETATAMTPDSLTWWPLFGSGTNKVAGAEAEVAAVHTKMQQRVTQQLWCIWGTSWMLDATLNTLPLNRVVDLETLRRSAVVWLLSATAASSGSSAIVEVAFAIAASLTRPFIPVHAREQSAPPTYRPQPLTTSHSRAYLPVDLIVSVLQLISSQWSSSDLYKFLLFIRSSGGNQSDQSLAAPAPLFTPPIEARMEEVVLTALTSSHAGVYLLQQRAVGPNAICYLPSSEVVI